jgi:hypothetical protein
MDTFRLQLPALGPLKMAAVWLEGHACPWHLELIVVTGPQGRCRQGVGVSRVPAWPLYSMWWKDSSHLNVVQESAAGPAVVVCA